MPLYAQHPVLRARQVAADLGMLAWIVLWVLVARAVHARCWCWPSRAGRSRTSGSSVAGNMDSAAEAAEDVPLVGDELAAPVRARWPTRAARCAARGRRRRTPSAPWRWCSPSSWCVLPVGWLLLRWLPWRLRYAREAGAARAAAGRHAGPGDPRRAGAGHRTPPPAGRAARRAPARPGGPATPRRCGPWPALELGRLGLRLPRPTGRCPARRAAERGQSASTGRSRGVVARACAAASSPTTALALRMSPSKTRWTASSSGTRSQRHVQLLVLDDEPLGPVDVGEVLGEVDQHLLVAEAGRAVRRRQQRPARRRTAAPPRPAPASPSPAAARRRRRAARPGAPRGARRRDGGTAAASTTRSSSSSGDDRDRAGVAARPPGRCPRRRASRPCRGAAR